MHKKKSLLFQNILLPIKLTVFLIIPIIKYPTYFLLKDTQQLNHGQLIYLQYKKFISGVLSDD